MTIEETLWELTKKQFDLLNRMERVIEVRNRLHKRYDLISLSLIAKSNKLQREFLEYEKKYTEETGKPYRESLNKIRLAQNNSKHFN